MHGCAVEALAIRLGFVNACADKYISDENLRRALAQSERNAQMLTNTYAVNDDGEIFTLAEQRWPHSFGQFSEIFKWNVRGNHAADLIAGSVAKYASSGV
ncbi:bacteriophage replication A domain protein [Burkholderia thailandensis 34]|nr:bacteriophage replication A domain protein [Burkholderia thailandensis 34]